MIQEFVDRYMANKDALAAIYAEKHPESYEEIVRNVVTALDDEDSVRGMDPNRIHEIDDGDYQGTLVYVIGGTGYQPDEYWYVKISYGSCSGCDTLESIRCYDSGKPREGQIADYMSLSLHVVEGLKKMGDDVVDG